MTKESATAVYWHINADGECVYVGVSGCPHCRVTGHMNTSSWITSVVRMDMRWFETREEALAFERNEIHRLKPRHNKEWQARGGNKWIANEGHVFVREWLNREGLTFNDFAQRLGVSLKDAKRLATEVVHVRVLKARKIAIATDGYVPTSAWQRPFLHRPFPPKLALPSAERAKEMVKENLDWMLNFRPEEIPPHAAVWLASNIQDGDAA